MILFPLVIFDDGLGDFGPLTDLRPAFDFLRTGAVTTRQRIERVLSVAAQALWVPPDSPGLTAVVREQYRGPVNALPGGASTWLAVNGRWTGLEKVDRVSQLTPGQCLVQANGRVVAACLAHRAAEALARSGWREIPAGIEVQRLDGRVLVEHPWQILDGLEAALAGDMAALDLPARASAGGKHSCKVAATAKVGLGAVLLTEKGPVAIAEHAVIGANTVLEGPCYIGEHSLVHPLALIRDNTVIGPHCKVGGEVEFGIIQGYSNKAHAGFLGHFLVGEWVNLGAETTVSDLKNTYGPVRVQLRSGREALSSGRMFQGPIIGDLVRTAIGTRLPTGACVGTGAMLAGSGMAEKYTPAFAFITDRGREGGEIEKVLATARTMMARRKVELSAAEETLLRRLHAESAAQ